MKNIIVAIDGPAGAGKSTITKIVAEKCNLTNIDTGAMYRCVALNTIINHVSLDEQEKIIELAKACKIEFDLNNKVFLNGNDVTSDIRSKEVTEIVSPVSSIVKVREQMVILQRKMAKGKNVIMEGRDITTVVFPNADFKFYLDASIEERAKRRFKEYQEKNINMSYEEILENIKKRDYNDMHKEIGSLIISKDAIYIDTSDISIEEVANKIINIIRGGKNES